MASLNKVLEDTALFSIGALAGAYSERFLLGFLKSKLIAMIFGLIVVALGIYVDNNYAEKLLIGFGLPYVALLLQWGESRNAYSCSNKISRNRCNRNSK